MAKSKTDSGESKMSKRQMVAAAFDAKGDLGPLELSQYIKEQHGVELPIPMISTYKSQLKKSRGLVKGRKSKPTATREPVANGRVDLKDVIAVKQLLNRMGYDQLQSIIEAVSDD